MELQVAPPGAASPPWMIEAKRWTDVEWQRIFPVRVLPIRNAPSSFIPMAGSYRVQDRSVRFEPQFGFSPGVTYESLFRTSTLPPPHAGANEVPLSDRHTVPARRHDPTTVVSSVYPTSGLLPENLLKFYLHFSAPMSRGHIYDHIHLRQQSGKEVELPFLEINEELWDPTMMRLTLFIDPGRIKRGLRPLEEIGPALETGKRYTLEIDRDWQDANGARLAHSFQKAFRVGPPDRECLDVASWQLRLPQAGSRGVLSVKMGVKMDEALAQRMIFVRDESGVKVAGRVRLFDQERRWELTPSKPWPVGSYEWVVEMAIEDLAGNNPDKPFDVDVDVLENVQKKLPRRETVRRFELHSLKR